MSQELKDLIGDSIVRRNLLTVRGYAPYCGNPKCSSGMPRAIWDNFYAQFVCACGWKSNFPKEFIEAYKRFKDNQ